MKNIAKSIVALICLIAFLHCFVAGTVLSLHEIVKKDNVVDIVEQYLISANSADAPETTPDVNTSINDIYKLLDGGSAEDITSLLSDGSILETLNGFYGLADMAQLSDGGFDLGDSTSVGTFGAFSNITSIFSMTQKLISGDYGVISLLLNAVDAKKLVSSEVISAALNDGKTAAYFGENAPEAINISAFLKTKLVSELTVEAAFVYYDHFKKGYDENWKETLRSSIIEISDSRKQDFSILLGRGVTAEDGEMIASLQNALADSITGSMTPPDVKAESFSNQVAALLGLFFSSGIVIVLMILFLVSFMLVLVINRDLIKSLMYMAGCLAVGGIPLVLMRNLNQYVIGGFYSKDAAGSGIRDAGVFMIVGLIYIAAGVATFIVLAIVKRAKEQPYKIKHQKQNDSDTITLEDVRVINQMNLGDLVMKGENPNKREDGLVDYYGDGRGLQLQREYRERQKMKEQERKESSENK
ncbi:MAG: hypothetical protein J5860_04410 [Clostridia bacterium]|nr:hypothetical protein [Clostridia bacterium]